MTFPLKKKKASPNRRSQSYEKIATINGKHSLQTLLPSLSVNYRARRRPGGTVSYFNFELAKEIGLVAADHPEEMNERLEESLLAAFGLVIINEYDLEHKRSFKEANIKENSYMATRYLQLQHPGRSGKTSGDGRSLWNGELYSNGCYWDFSSCGTGATRLSPASVIQKKFFQTGDPKVSYGCGTADLFDGLAALLMSEIFHKQGIPTERTLLLIRYPKNTSINVRATKNLLRPAHFFRYLKQNKLEELKILTNYFVERQVKNGDWTPVAEARKYDRFLEHMTLAFAKSAAQFENEYIFCWFDWDGDNILASDAGLLDFGSVRQFGLFHKEYRYDDVSRFSTNLLEQKHKARYIVQCFAQMIDFIKSGRKKSVRRFVKHSALKAYEQHFKHYKRIFLLKRVGLNESQAEKLLESAPREVEAFLADFEYFERMQSSRGVYRVEDGVTSDALFSMRDLLRELPKHYLAGEVPIDPGLFQEIAASSYAQKADLHLSPTRRFRIRRLQRSYLQLVTKFSEMHKRSLDRSFLELTMRSSIVNRYDRITGNSVLHATEIILEGGRAKDFKKLTHLAKQFIALQSNDRTQKGPKMRGASRRTLQRLIRLLEECREEV